MQEFCARPFFIEFFVVYFLLFFKKVGNDCNNFLFCVYL